ncbi:hypothetical protein PHLCEN_2v10158 [Hermanssonia centrifuga]|uniref:Uncharacterized protein n=1 Tax=Hermanssonia centrifuga TaxID=98765 RepID=A0A2R6NNP4_9APHY|nr:hypothetical protein PHLCEN_2v10158 [Hermanssonia centrifuga]
MDLLNVALTKMYQKVAPNWVGYSHLFVKNYHSGKLFVQPVTQLGFGGTGILMAPVRLE